MTPLPPDLGSVTRNAKGTFDEGINHLFFDHLWISLKLFSTKWVGNPLVFFFSGFDVSPLVGKAVRHDEADGGFKKFGQVRSGRQVVRVFGRTSDRIRQDTRPQDATSRLRSERKGTRGTEKVRFRSFFIVLSKKWIFTYDFLVDQLSGWTLLVYLTLLSLL